MNKEEYLQTLRKELTNLAVTNIDSRIEYYSEMIDDRIEDGLTEEEAVSSMESIESIIEASKLEKPMPLLVKEKVKKSKDRATTNGWGVLWIVLAIVGFPVWLPLLLVCISLLFVAYLVFWSILIALFVVELGLGVSALATLAGFFVSFPFLSLPGKLATIGAAFFLGGVTVLLWKPIVLLAKGAVKVFAAFINWIKRKFFA